MPSLLEAAGLVNGPLGPIDVSVQPGQCVVVQGRSGSGKTLLLRALADLDPSGGMVSLEGTPRQERLYPSPWDPTGGPAVGHIENRAALDGFAVVHDYEHERNGSVTYRGHGIFTWDAPSF